MLASVTGILESSKSDGGYGFVTRGIVTALDSRQTDSYSGSGTTWSDLSGNGNDAVLSGGIVQDVDNSFIFDGVNDVSTTSILTSVFSSGNASLCIYLKNFSASSNTQNNVLAYGDGVDAFLYAYGNGLGYIGTFRSARVDSIALSGSVTRTNFHQLTFTTANGGNWNMYQNNILVKTVSAEATVKFLDQYIGRDPVNVNKYKGNVSSLLIYNVELTTAEIASNLTYNQSL